MLFNSLEEYIESANADIYDFKFQFDEKMYMDIEKYCEYRKCHNPYDSNNIRRLYSYKMTPDVVSFDCDGTISAPSNYIEQEKICFLTRMVYRTLWGWSDKKEDTNLVYRYAKCDFENIQMGPETMNTLAITIINAVRNSEEFGKSSTVWQEYLKDVFPDKKNCSKVRVSNAYVDWLLCKKTEKVCIFLEEYNKSALLVSTIGNFVLVPAYFNPMRGCDAGINDYWDRSLKELKNKCNLVYKSRWNTIKIEWNNKWFNKYINFFFLWEYVDEKGEPIVISNDKYIDNIENRIHRRSYFMLGMIKLANMLRENSEYNILKEEVFEKEDIIYSGYEEVFEAMVNCAMRKGFIEKIEVVIECLREQLESAD